MVCVRVWLAEQPVKTLELTDPDAVSLSYVCACVQLAEQYGDVLSKSGAPNQCWSADMRVALVQVHLAAHSFAQHLGKLVCNSQDRPGFIVNRVLMPMINEAFYARMEVSHNTTGVGFCLVPFPKSQCSNCQSMPAPLPQRCCQDWRQVWGRSHWDDWGQGIA